MKNRKEQFLTAVRILAPGEDLILQAAKCISGAKLQGGSEGDRAAAGEWISMLLHEAVLH